MPITEERINYCKQKGAEAIHILQPIFKAKNFDFNTLEYKVVPCGEWYDEYLFIADDVICCTGNSVSAIVDEAITWLFYEDNMRYYHNEIDTDYIKRHWSNKKRYEFNERRQSNV